jgi:hypothetical protein
MDRCRQPHTQPDTGADRRMSWHGAAGEVASARESLGGFGASLSAASFLIRSFSARYVLAGFGSISTPTSGLPA